MSYPALSSRYRLTAPLGAGAMGQVFVAADRLTVQAVALKQVLLPPGLTSDEVAHELLTLAHEFRVLAGLRHPHIISVLDYGFDARRQPFYTMELLPGACSILEAGAALPLADRVGLLIQALEALAYLHRRGILHHDLKPANILVAGGRLRLLDFGLAVLAHQPRDDDAFGTLQYLAPEVLDGQPYSEAADLYSLGVVAYELLVGQHPFPAETVYQLFDLVLTQPPDLAPLAGAPALAEALGKLLAGRRRERGGQDELRTRALVSGDTVLRGQAAGIFGTCPLQPGAAGRTGSVRQGRSKMTQRASSESQQFKAYFGPPLVEDLARRLLAVHPAFPATQFIAEVTPQLAPLELKGRVAAIAAGLRRHLPPDYPAAVRLLLAILGAPHSEAEGMFTDGWFLMPVAAFVEHYGLEHLDESLEAMHAITQRHTAEFAIRPFLLRYPEQTLAALRVWAHDPSFHVRRLVSEGARPRLPWAARLPAFLADPTPVLALLETLKDDPSNYVRKSVANNLNDIAKDHPELVLTTLARWQQGASAERRWIIRHALRTLVKQGHPEALRLLGAEAPEVALVALELTPATLRIGETVTIAVTLRSTAAAAQQLVVDYVLHLPGARGAARAKVFKLRSQVLAAGEIVRLVKRHSFAPVTVRRIYPGPHRIAVQVNGLILGEATVQVGAAEG